MSNGRAERTECTLKGAIGKRAAGNRSRWDEHLSSVLQGCRRRHLTSGIHPFELLYGVEPCMNSDEGGVVARLGDSSDVFRSVELLASRGHRAKLSALRPLKEVGAAPITKFEVGDLAFVARGKALSTTAKWPPFSSKCFGSFRVVRANHPRYTLVSPHNRYTRHGVHVLRLKNYIAHSMEG